jgi:hypothetical protein
LCSCQDQTVPGDVPEQPVSFPPSALSDNLHSSEDEVD